MPQSGKNSELKNENETGGILQRLSVGCSGVDMAACVLCMVVSPMLQFLC